MKEFSCSSLGNACSWRHVARTENLLADMVAIHLRDVHGKSALTEGEVTRIRQAFTNPSPIEAREAEQLVMKEYRCDLGPSCAWHYLAQTEELIADGVAVHAREAHGITDLTPEMKTRIENALAVWKG